MQSVIETASVSKGELWAGRIVTAVVVVFLVFDGVAKLLKVRQVLEATVRIGFPESTIVGIGATLLVCTALYVIPRTSVLGAILLTAYLGGATARMCARAVPFSIPSSLLLLVFSFGLGCICRTGACEL